MFDKQEGFVKQLKVNKREVAINGDGSKCKDHILPAKERTVAVYSFISWWTTWWSKEGNKLQNRCNVMIVATKYSSKQFLVIIFIFASALRRLCFY